MKKITYLLLMILTAASVVACNEKPSTTPPTEPPVVVQLDDAMSFEGDTIRFRSIVVDQKYSQGQLLVMASVDEGITTTEEMIKVDASDKPVHKPLLVAFNLEAFNRTIDVFDDSGIAFSIVNYTGLCGAIETVTAIVTDQVSAGALKIGLDGEDLVIDFSLTDKKSGKLLQCNITTNYKPDPIPTSNILTVDGGVSAVKSQFYKLTDQGVELYLTPSKISSSDLLTQVNSYYMQLATSKWIANNTKIDITKVEEDFFFEYYSPKDEQQIVVKYGELDGATGWFQVNNKSEGVYVVDFEITKGGRTFKCQFEGEFSKIDKFNQFTVDNGAPIAIKSVIVDKKAGADGRWDIYLSPVAAITTVEQMKTSGDAVTLVFNEKYFNGEIYGFSVYPDIEIQYKGIVYNYANDRAGNILGVLDGENIKLEFNLFNLADGDIAMVGFYDGSYITIE